MGYIYFMDFFYFITGFLCFIVYIRKVKSQGIIDLILVRFQFLDAYHKKNYYHLKTKRPSYFRK